MLWLMCGSVFGKFHTWARIIQRNLIEVHFQSHSSVKVKECLLVAHWSQCVSVLLAHGAELLWMLSKYQFMSFLADEVLKHGP